MSTTTAPPIQPARLLSRNEHGVPGQLRIAELFFQVPLNHDRPESGSITLFARSANRHSVPITPPTVQETNQAAQRPWFVYLEGGPGFGNLAPQNSQLARLAIARGYQVLFPDYRGTGLSTPATAAGMLRVGGSGDQPSSPERQAEYLRLFRQDNIVRDLEAVRLCLTADWPEEKKKWSLFGQSFGGFVILTYLSFRPDGVREAFLSGGLAPVGKTPDQVYEATYRKVIERNEHYYARFPGDVAAVRRVIAHIQSRPGGKIRLPAGGLLTVPRFLTLGVSFGQHGGEDSVHGLLLWLTSDLDQFGTFTRVSLAAVEHHFPFDNAIIYAILHEAIYCSGPGVASRWAAKRVGGRLEQFRWLNNSSSGGDDRENPFFLPPPSSSPAAAAAPAPAPAPAAAPAAATAPAFDAGFIGSGSGGDGDALYFSGEMVFPLAFEVYPELVPLCEAAEILARHDAWPALYDEMQLRRNRVPVYAASYIQDMFVDFEFARETAAMVAGTKVWETNALLHDAIRSHADEVFRQLMILRDDIAN